MVETNGSGLHTLVGITLFALTKTKVHSASLDIEYYSHQISCADKSDVCQDTVCMRCFILLSETKLHGAYNNSYNSTEQRSCSFC
jgi:hypothetical protein